MRQAITGEEQRGIPCGAGATGLAARRPPGVSARVPAVHGRRAAAYIYRPPDPERPRHGATL